MTIPDWQGGGVRRAGLTFRPLGQYVDHRMPGDEKWKSNDMTAWIAGDHSIPYSRIFFRSVIRLIPRISATFLWLAF
jgi:hypothetical protein